MTNHSSIPPSRFVAEVSSNHYRDLERCRRFIKTAAAIGCSAVKFQLFRIDELFAPEILEHSETHRKRRTWELPGEFLAPLSRCAQEAGVQFSCTPFYLEAVEELLPFVDFYKVASYELLWHELLAACAATGKPVVLSTGMATIPEVDEAVAVLKQNGCQDLTLLHCVSGYPTPAIECNLSALELLRERYECAAGWSDHSVSPAVIQRAVHRWQAAMIEFHLDLDGRGAEYAAGHCWLPDEIGEVITQLQVGVSADGIGEKTPQPSELPDRVWRADPADGLRPLRRIRSSWQQGQLQADS